MVLDSRYYYLLEYAISIYNDNVAENYFEIKAIVSPLGEVTFTIDLNSKHILFDDDINEIIGALTNAHTLIQVFSIVDQLDYSDNSPLLDKDSAYDMIEELYLAMMNVDTRYIRQYLKDGAVR